jgi:hypothetical protein
MCRPRLIELITNGRSLHSHKNWMSNLTTPLLVIEGDTTVEERVEVVLGKIGELSLK